MIFFFKEKENGEWVERLDKASTAYGMEISAEKTKPTTNNTSGINTEIKVNNNNNDNGYFQTPIIKTSKRFTRS